MTPDHPQPHHGEPDREGEPAPDEGGDGLSYAKSILELESILAELEDDNLDVDRLGQRVARAATLIRSCRARLADTRMEVERIVTGLDGPPPPAANAP